MGEPGYAPEPGPPGEKGERGRRSGDTVSGEPGKRGVAGSRGPPGPPGTAGKEFLGTKLSFLLPPFLSQSPVSVPSILCPSAKDVVKVFGVECVC